MAHYPCIGWVQIGGAWALCVFYSHVSLGLVCCSCICHGLWISLILLRILLLIFNPLWHGVTGSSFSASHFFLGLGFARVWVLPSSIQLLPSLWISWHLCHASPLLLPCYRLTCTWRASFGLAAYFSFTQFTLPCTSAGLVLMLSLAFLAHFIPLGILGPLHFLGHPWSIPLLHSHGLLLNLFGFPGPITIPFTNSFLWASSAHFCLLSIPYDNHGLTTFFFGLPWAHLLSLEPFYYFIGPQTIIPAIWA